MKERNALVTRMSLCVLGSGSGGNCSVLRCEGQDGFQRIMLIDGGLSVRQTRLRLAAVGIDIEDVHDIIVTHFDHDHFRAHSWRRAAARGLDITVHFHVGHERIAHRRGIGHELNGHAFDDDPFDLFPEVQLSPVRCAHDQAGTTTFRLDTDVGAVGYATDLGRVPQSLLRTFAGVRLLAIESNYCVKMQQDSPRPWFLKQRIMGGAGHLSNEEARRVVMTLHRPPHRLEHVLLLHLSRECNTPERVLAHYRDHAALADCVTVSRQDRPTHWAHLDPDPVAETVRRAAQSPSPSQRQQLLFS